MKETSDLIGQRALRLQKTQKLRDIGIDPFPSIARKTHSNSEITNDFLILENKEVTVIGRLINWREHGKIIFGEIRDQSGTLQLYIKEDELIKISAENLSFDELGLIDIGDFIVATGIVTKTQKGEISVLPKHIKIASKSIRPIPNDFKDKEERFRRRYVDMNVNTEIVKMFERKAKFWEAHREFLNSRGFFEVNIPILEHVPGGGDAVPFVTHMNAIHEDFFLRISHELPLKRLIGGGFEKVYDIGARFRNEGLSDEHLPEHVAMEFYWAYANWEDGMKLIQDLFNFVIKKTYNGKTNFNIKGFEVSFDGEWERIDFNQIMKERFGIDDIYTIDLKTVKSLLTENNIDFDDSTINIPRGVDSLWKLIRKTVAGPAFLVNHPKYLSPLQKPSLKNPNIVERCQPIIAGSELGNGWSELNDPVEQYDRFIEQQELRNSGDDEAQWLDIDYVEMLEYGMPPTFGWGHSERVFWFLENVTAKEGVPFPAMKRFTSETTKKIYPEVVELIEHAHSSVSQKAESKKEKTIEQDFNNKIIIVVNRELELWQISNTIAHISAYIGNILTDKFSTGESFITKDEIKYPRNSQYPIVILSAKSGQMSNFMSTVKKSAEDKNLLWHGFLREMLDMSKDSDIQELLNNKNESDLEYLGIGLFGNSDILKKLTTKFSLFK